jgi:hypothetical protein
MCIEGFQYNLALMFTIVRHSQSADKEMKMYIRIKVTHKGQSLEKRNDDVNKEHLVIIYEGIVNQMVIIMTMAVIYVISVNICKVTVTKGDKILKYPDLSRGYLLHAWKDYYFLLLT